MFRYVPRSIDLAPPQKTTTTTTQDHDLGFKIMILIFETPSSIDRYLHNLNDLDIDLPEKSNKSTEINFGCAVRVGSSHSQLGDSNYE